jgi:hypothetical protein
MEFDSMADTCQRSSTPAYNIVLINESELSDAQAFVVACEFCSTMAGIPFDYLLDAITGCDPCVTEYLMCRRVECPCCFCELSEKTRVVAG